MNRSILLIALVLLSGTHLFAQVPGSLPISDMCLLNTPEETWMALGLSGEQLEQVKTVQTLCQTDCTALQETGESDPALAQAMLEKHREKIREVLSREQYDKWLAWCSQVPAKG